MSTLKVDEVKNVLENGPVEFPAGATRGGSPFITEEEFQAESVHFAATKAAADSLAASLPDGATVITDRDETAGGVQTRRVVTGGVLGAIVSFFTTAMVAWKHGGASSVFRTLYSRLMDLPISVIDFGALPNEDSDAAHTANNAAFAAAITASVAAGSKDIFVPAGVYWITAASGLSTGLQINVPSGNKVRFIGEAGTVIKRRAAPVMGSTSALVWMYANTDIEIEWVNFTFDGNEQNCEYDAGAPFSEEQSANIKWRSGSGTPNAIRFFECDVGKGRVGDGYQANIRVNHFMASNCSTTDTSVRRVRSDWQFSRYATYDTLMTNCVCNSFESEPSDTQPTARLLLANILSRSSFDLAGDVSSIGGDLYPVRVELTNVTCLKENGRSGLPYVNFFRVHGTAVNCNFRGINRIQKCKLKIIGGSITVEDNGGGAAAATKVWYDHSEEGSPTLIDAIGGYVEFHGVTFKKDATVTTGNYLETSGIVDVSDLISGATLPRISVFNCFVPEPIDTVVSAAGGALEIRGGTLRGNVSIFNFSASGSRVGELVCDACMAWDAPALMAQPSSTFEPTTGYVVLNLSGEINGETMIPWENGGTRISVGGAAIWNNTMIAYVESNPQGRIRTIPGLRAKLRNQKWGEPSMWRVINTGTMNATGHNGTDWRAIDLGGRKNTTANRPTTLGVYDSGFVYFDTTIDADGKPVWWTGTAWVDATGAVV